MPQRAAKSLFSALLLEPSRMVAGLWGRWDLVWQFTQRAIELRHRGSRLGAAWALVNPLTMLALYYFVFGIIYKTRFNQVPGETAYDFSLALFLGLALFHVFTETLSAAPNLIVTNPNFVKKVVFPLEILPVAQLGAAVFHLLVSLGLILFGSMFGTLGLSWHVLWLPVLLLPLVLLSMGVSWLLAALGVFIRDIGQVTAFIATALLFASGVMYPLERLSGGFEFLHYNPLLQIVDLARHAVLWQHPVNWHDLAFVYACSIAIFVFGAMVFAVLRKSFAEVI